MALSKERLHIVDLEGLRACAPEVYEEWVGGLDKEHEDRLRGLPVRFAQVPETGAWVLIGQAGRDMILAWNPGPTFHGWTFYEYFEGETWVQIFGEDRDPIWDPYVSPLYRN